MEQKHTVEKDVARHPQSDVTRQAESAPATAAQWFYAEFTKRADVRELLRRLAR